MKKRIILKWKDFNPDYEGWEHGDVPSRRLQEERSDFANRRSQKDRIKSE